jgi:hypothetical protein
MSSPEEIKKEKINKFMRRIAFPFTLINLVISASMFFMSTGIALTNGSFKSYIIFVVFFVLYLSIMILLFLRKTIIIHTMMFSTSLFIFFYNFIPYLYLKNSNQLITNNYVTIISCMTVVFSIIIYYVGYMALFNNCINNKTTDPQLRLPDCELLMSLISGGTEQSKIVRNSLISTLFLTFIMAFVSVSIVLGCFGSAYFPNYILFTTQNMCSRPTNQTFKCSMYQNGKIITATL